MNAKELTSELVYAVQHRGRWLRPVIDFTSWHKVAALFIPVVVRRLDQAAREHCDGARVGLIFDGGRKARVVVVDSAGAASTIAIAVGWDYVELQAGGLYWTRSAPAVNGMVTHLCSLIANKLAPSY